MYVRMQSSDAEFKETVAGQKGAVAQYFLYILSKYYSGYNLVK